MVIITIFWTNGQLCLITRQYSKVLYKINKHFRYIFYVLDTF